MLDPEEHEPDCPTCGSYMVWVDCHECDDGYVDLYEQDPEWYGEGDIGICETCQGNSGWYVCPVCHPQAVET